MASEDLVFALDIGTRSVIGVVGYLEEDRFKVVAIEKQHHQTRSMIDGQIEDIDRVSRVVSSVRDSLEKKLSVKLPYVCVAAAGRALKTQKASYEIVFPNSQAIDDEIISRLEAGAISSAETEFSKENGETEKQFYLVGYTVSQYYLDGYPIQSLKEHHGKKITVDLIATFLPAEVVESLYVTMQKSNLEITSLTLEPIAAINAAIPKNIRLLNLALVDIGAGTSDIAVCKDGSVVGYTMVTVAGDEITETIMRQYLTDFQTAEEIKSASTKGEDISFTDILGLEHSVTADEIREKTKPSSEKLAKDISEKILDVNASAPPSAVFLAGGGSKLEGLCQLVANNLGMDSSRVAVAGGNFKICAFSDEYDIFNPEYATPLGIAVSAGMNLINDSFRVTLNGKRAKLFRSGSLSVRDVLMMNGYSIKDFISRGGENITISLNGKRKTVYGEPSQPAELKINGIDEKISATVHAGDNIEFIPAIPGNDAHATVGEVAQKQNDSDVILVNYELASLSTEIKTGDIVSILTEEEYYSSADETRLKKDQLENERLMEAEKIARSVEENAKNPSPTEQIDQKLEEELKEQAEIEEIKETESNSNGNKISIELNGIPICLDSKEEGYPYYIFDLLELSGLDLDDPKGEIVLKLNGQNGAYQDSISDGDRVEIYASGYKY